ncbi:MAG: DNA polymerase II [Burkholderiaceae bacterium]|nr:DNA polymerase II [Burkholderiaceae bacterium]
MDGFILTRHWRDTKDGTEIEFWLATDDGPRKVLLTDQVSVAFARAEDQRHVELALGKAQDFQIKSLDLKTFRQEPVIGVYTRHFKQLGRLERKMKDLGLAVHEADIRPPERYLMERFITAGVTVEGGVREGAVITNCKLKPAPDYRPAIKMVSLDIETSAHEDLYSIALDGCGRRTVFMLGAEPAEQAEAPGFALIYCASRKEMIARLNDWFEAHDPDAIIGWSLIQFDLRVLQKAADAVGVPLQLGRERGTIAWREHPAREHLFAPTAGRMVIDGIEALRSAFWNFPSFSLENVSQTLLGEGKDIEDTYGKMAEIERRFQQDKLALAVYNIRDCELVLRIFEKAKVLEFVLERSHATGLQADKFGGSIAAFSHHYLPRMHRAGYVAPNIGEIPSGSYPGGFVMDSRPGLYDSVVVLDYKSLYASIIRTFLVDPVGLAEGTYASDPATTVEGINGTVFSRDKHCLPGIVKHIWEQRDVAKRASNEPLSQALKTLMNSFAGVLGASECRFFNPALAAAITLRGHDMMKQTRKFVEQRGYEAIYGDTDSIFIWLRKRHENNEAIAIGEKLAEDINQWWRRTLWKELGLESFLEIEFDTHYQRFFMPTIRGTEQGSKKRYAGLTINSKGEEEIVYRGLETARSDWTPLAQQFQQGLLSRIFRAEPYREYVQDYVRQTLAGKFDDLLVYRKRLRHRIDDYQVNVPPQVRAARLADEHNAALQRPLQYQRGGWIRYLMTTNGPEPLEIVRSRIDYQHYLSKQLQPIADVILLPLNDSFTALTTPQQGLF